MLVSCNWLKRYVDFDLTTEQLDEILTMLGIEVEGCNDLKERYKGFYVAKVTSKEKHPNADRLSLCMVSIGGEALQVVCGAPNVEAGQVVVLGVVGAVVPTNGITLERRKIRDVYSEGMICSQEELDLGDDHSGILVLPDDTPVGMPIADYLNLNDVILDLSLTPNKSDCNSHLGIAREIAAALQKEIVVPTISFEESTTKTKKAIKLSIEDKELCPRYVARVICNVRNCESPAWLQNELFKIGLRPRNVIVDVTNYVLMDLGHPLHSFDYDKVIGHKIVVKKGFNDVSFRTLDDKSRKLDKDMLMICDTEKPIAIAGVMGGQNSEIDENTTNVVLESAFFNPSSIRRTAKTLGLQTDASYRFERGCDIDMAVYALDKAAQMITELAGGEILDGIVEFYPRRIKPKKLLLRFDYARKMIGADIDNQEMRDALHYLGFGVPKNIGRMKSIPVFVPTRRVDVSDEIDLIEEIARIYNYDRIESDYQSTVNYLRDAIPPTLKPLPLRNTIREYLAHSGYTELLTPNIIDPSSAALTCQNPIRIENPLGEEMSVMRPSMIPPVLKVISFNLRQGNDNLKLFETGKVFIPQNNIVNSFVADIDEREEAVIALVGNDAPRQWSRNEREYGYFDIKGDIVALLQYIRLPNFKIKSLQEPHPIFDENSGELFIDGEHIGYVGGINKNILQKYEIEVPVFIASIDLTTISDYQIPTPQYMPVSPYPVIKRDLAFLIDEKYTAREVLKTIKAKASRLLTSVNIFDVYNGKGIPQGKRSIGFELTFSSNERTLVDTEVEADIKIIIEAVKRNFEAELRDN